MGDRLPPTRVRAGQRLGLQGVAAASVRPGWGGPAGPREAEEGCFPGFPRPRRGLQPRDGSPEKDGRAGTRRCGPPLTCHREDCVAGPPGERSLYKK